MLTARPRSVLAAKPIAKLPGQAAAPAGFKVGVGSTSRHPVLAAFRASLQALDATAVRDRFFANEGPTNMFQILAAVDNRIAGINSRLSQFSCINKTAPVNYTLRVWDRNVTFAASCSETWSGSSGFDQFALTNNFFYMFEYSAEVMTAARLTLDANGNTTLVEIWYSVGLSNRNGSHAVTQIKAVPGASPVFEMSLAGQGIGFCGAQLISDGTTVRIVGSTDQGASCGATDSVCVTAADVTVTTACTAGVNTFSLPAYGRLSYVNGNGITQGASAYPGGGSNQITLTATGADDTFFGPTTPVI